MKQDPFGNLLDWGHALELIAELAENATLGECQPGLIRILRYKGNWQLREEVLKRISEIQNPSDELVFQVLAILADDNIYYDARILAGEAMIPLIKGLQDDSGGAIDKEIQKVVEKISSIPQPPFFDKALKRIRSELGRANITE